MVETKDDVLSMIEVMSESDFSRLCDILNSSFQKTPERKSAEDRFISEVKAAEASVARGNYVTLSQMHEYLGI